MQDSATLREKLDGLVADHRRLDDQIEERLAEPSHNELQIKRMKLEKLRLKDEIVRLESLLIPDIIA